MEAIFTRNCPQNYSTIRPCQNTTMWGPHEKKKGADSRALLGPVVCQNSFSFGPQSAVIHSQVVEALQCPGHFWFVESAFAAKMEAIFTCNSPQNYSTIRPCQNTSMWGPHEKKKGRIVEHFWGPWCAKIASLLAPEAP